MCPACWLKKDWGRLRPLRIKLQVHEINFSKRCTNLIPIIHKPKTPRYPVVSACSCPTVHFSEFFLFTVLPSFVKDTNHALNILQSTRLPRAIPISLFFWVCVPFIQPSHTRMVCGNSVLPWQESQPTSYCCISCTPQRTRTHRYIFWVPWQY